MIDRTTLILAGICVLLCAAATYWVLCIFAPAIVVLSN
jgi:hypothetical protein